MNRKRKDDYLATLAKFIVDLILSAIHLLLYSAIIYWVIHITGLDKSIYLEGLSFIKVCAILIVLYCINVYLSINTRNLK